MRTCKNRQRFMICLDCGTSETGACAICGVAVRFAGRIPEYFCTVCPKCMTDLGVQVCPLCGDPESKVCPSCDPEREVCATCGNPCSWPKAELHPDVVDFLQGIRTYWKEHPLLLDSMRMGRLWEAVEIVVEHDHATGEVLRYIPGVAVPCRHQRADVGEEDEDEELDAVCSDCRAREEIPPTIANAIADLDLGGI